MSADRSEENTRINRIAKENFRVVAEIVDVHGKQKKYFASQTIVFPTAKCVLAIKDGMWDIDEDRVVTNRDEGVFYRVEGAHFPGQKGILPDKLQEKVEINPGLGHYGRTIRTKQDVRVLEEALGIKQTKSGDEGPRSKYTQFPDDWDPKVYNPPHCD